MTESEIQTIFHRLYTADNTAEQTCKILCNLCHALSETPNVNLREWLPKSYPDDCIAPEEKQSASPKLQKIQVDQTKCNIYVLGKVLEKQAKTSFAGLIEKCCRENPGERLSLHEFQQELEAQSSNDAVQRIPANNIQANSNIQSSNAMEEHSIVVIGDVGAGKTILAAGLDLQAFGQRVICADNETTEKINVIRDYLNKGDLPPATSGGPEKLCYVIRDKNGAHTSLNFQDYRGESFQENCRFLETLLQDNKPVGIVLLLNTKTLLENKNKDRAIKLLLKTIQCAEKLSRPPIAFVRTASDLAECAEVEDDIKRVQTVLDTYPGSHESFETSVIRKNPKQEGKWEFISNNNAAEPFIWLLDQINSPMKQLKKYILSPNVMLMLAVILFAVILFGIMAWNMTTAENTSAEKENAPVVDNALKEDTDTKEKDLWVEWGKLSVVNTPYKFCNAFKELKLQYNKEKGWNKVKQEAQKKLRELLHAKCENIDALDDKAFWGINAVAESINNPQDDFPALKEWAKNYQKWYRVHSSLLFKITSIRFKPKYKKTEVYISGLKIEGPEEEIDDDTDSSKATNDEEEYYWQSAIIKKNCPVTLTLGKKVKIMITVNLKDKTYYCTYIATYTPGVRNTRKEDWYTNEGKNETAQYSMFFVIGVDITTSEDKTTVETFEDWYQKNKLPDIK